MAAKKTSTARVPLEERDTVRAETGIKKTMCHHTLKGVVCKGTCFLDAQGTTTS